MEIVFPDQASIQWLNFLRNVRLVLHLTPILQVVSPGDGSTMPLPSYRHLHVCGHGVSWSPSHVSRLMEVISIALYLLTFITPHIGSPQVTQVGVLISRVT